MNCRQYLENIGVALRYGNINASTKYYIFEDFADFYNLLIAGNIKDCIIEEFFLDETCLVKPEHWFIKELEDFMQERVDKHNEQVKYYFDVPYCTKYFVKYDGNLYVYIDEPKDFETDPRIFSNKTTNPYYLERASLIGKKEDSGIIKKKIEEYNKAEDERLANGGEPEVNTLDILYGNTRDKLKLSHLIVDFIEDYSKNDRLKYAFSKNSKKKYFIETLLFKKYETLKDLYLKKSGADYVLNTDGEEFFEKCLTTVKEHQHKEETVSRSGVNSTFYQKRKVSEDITETLEGVELNINDKFNF